MAIVRVETRKGQSQSTVEAPGTWDVGSFTDAQISAAVTNVEEWTKFAFPDSPDVIPAFWPRPPIRPGVEEVDLGHLEQSKIDPTKLLASQAWLKVDRLIWHLSNPGVAMHLNPFTSMPLVMVTYDGSQLIIDGHHRLGALLLLGAKDIPVWLLPEPAVPPLPQLKDPFHA